MSVFEQVLTVCPDHTGVFGAGAGAARGTAGSSGAGSSGDGGGYPALVAEHGAAAEALGADAMLVYDFWQSLDPWLAAQLVLSGTKALEPVVAVNPALTHPVTAARAVAGLTHLYGRRVNLNVVAGAKASELAAFGLPDPGGERHLRLAEFVAALRAVLAAEPFEGRWYRLATAPLEPLPDPALAPRILAPGSTSPGADRVLPLLDRALVMAKPQAEIAAEHARLAGAGLRGGLAMIVGVTARSSEAEAWELARARHTGDRRTALANKVFTRSVTSSQHTASLRAAAGGEVQDECLWYGADRLGMDCPKLVGSYRQVGAALAAYRRLGVTALVVDLPADPAEYEHVGRALDAAADVPDESSANRARTGE